MLRQQFVHGRHHESKRLERRPGQVTEVLSADGGSVGSQSGRHNVGVVGVDGGWDTSKIFRAEPCEGGGKRGRERPDHT